jgi:hypothetical protein
MKKELLVAVLLAGFSFAASPDRSKSALSHFPGVMWQEQDFGQRFLLFLPESLFQKVPLEDLESLPLPPRSADAIRQAVRWSREQTAAGRDHCNGGILGALPAGVANRALEGLDWLRSARYVLLGIVERLTPGIDVDGEAGTLIHVRVTRVLKDDAIIPVGVSVSLLEDMGRANIGGVEVCTQKQFYRLPRPQEEIVVGGDPDPVNPGHFDGDAKRGVFFVRNGVLERGAEAPGDWKPISLDQLERVLRETDSH